LYCGAPFDPASPAHEQANLYATLTELNHYQDESVPFVAKYSPDGDPISDHRPPYGSIYLTLRRDRTPAGLRECVARLATYLTHDLATPLGADLECRRESAPPPQLAPFRSFGTSTVWYPRGLLLRVAARQACGRLLEVWRSPGQPEALPQIDMACAQPLAAPEVQTDGLVTAIDQAVALSGEGTPAEATERFLASIEVQAASADDAGLWSAQALERIREWAGSGVGRDPDSPWQKSRFFRAMQLAAKQLSEEWDERLTKAVLPVLQYPGCRLSYGEAAFRRLIDFCDQAAAAQLQSIERQFETLKPVRDALQAAQAQCQAGGFKLFGGGSQRALRYFLAQAGQFVRQRITQDLLECNLLFFRMLRGRLEDRVKEISFSRQRLKMLEQVLASPACDWDAPGTSFDAEMSATSPLPMIDPFWEAVQGTSTAVISLPFGLEDLEETAAQFVDSLTPEHLLQLDEVLQDKVLAPLGDLLSACTGNMNLMKHLGRPLVEQAAEYLGAILPIRDVAQVEYTTAQGTDIAEKLRQTYAGAAPTVGGAEDDWQAAYLLVPDSEAGQTLADEAEELVRGLQPVTTTALTELTVCRESGGLTHAELAQLLNLGRMAYQEKAPQPTTSPHARFDVMEWLPLEP
jgi:hypothetical protein